MCILIFPVKNLGKKVCIIHSKIQSLKKWLFSLNSLPPAQRLLCTCSAPGLWDRDADPFTSSLPGFRLRQIR